MLIVSEQLIVDDLAEHPAVELYRDRFVLCGWSGAPSTNSSPTLEQFEAMPFVQYSTGERPNLADDALDRAGVVRRVEVRAESQLLIPYLLRGTPLVSLVPKRLARFAQEAAQLRFTAAPLEIPPIIDTAIWNARRSSDPAHHWFVDRLIAAAGTVD